MSEKSEAGSSLRGSTPEVDIPTLDVPSGLSGMLRSIGKFFKTTALQVLGAVVAVLVAAVVSWMSPLGDVIKDKVWPEDIEISGELPALEKEARELRLILQTKTRAGFSGGTIKIKSRDGSIDFVGDTVFVVTATEGSVHVPEPGKLKIRPKTSGKHMLDVNLITNRGKKFEGVIEVAVEPRVHNPYVGTDHNWIGTWGVILNGIEGEMTITGDDESRHLSGNLKLDTGNIFTLSPASWHDGTSFLIKLVSNKKEVLLEGLPCTVTDSGARWRILNAKVSMLEQGKLISSPSDLKTIRQRCDNMFSNLKDYKGDGAFEARIRLSTD